MKVPTPHSAPKASSAGLAQAFIHDIKPSVFQAYQKRVSDVKRNSKYQPKVGHTQNEPNGLYFFLRSNLELKSARYWSPPLLTTDSVSNKVGSSSVSADGYFQQTDGDSSFISTPYWFRLKNRRDFYTHDEFLSVLLTEAYWEQQLVKVVANPSNPPLKRKGWNTWTRLSVKDKSAAPSTSVSAAPASASLSKSQKSNNLFLVSEGENSDLVALRRPFRQRFFALFRAITEDYNGDAFVNDWVEEKVAELKVGLKLWLNPDLLIAHGESVPNSTEALNSFFPGGKVTRYGFLPSALEFLSFGGFYQYQFPVPYNLFGKLHIHPNFTTALQQQHHLDLSNTGNVFYTHNSWQPVNEKRVGNTYAGYLTDASHNAKGANAKDNQKLPGFESTPRTESVNAVISSLWSYFLRRRFFTIRPSANDQNLGFNDIGLPIYRRRDTVPFGTIRLNLFKKRAWKQLYPTGDPSAVSNVWSLRPNSRANQLTEDVNNTTTSFDNYFKNVDKEAPEFGHNFVKAF